MSLVYRLMRGLFGLLTVLVRSDLSKMLRCWYSVTRTRSSAVSSAAGLGGVAPTSSGWQRCRD